MNSLARSAFAGISVLAAMTAVVSAPAQKPAAAPKAVGFVKADAVLKARCVGCHMGPGGRAGVDLSSYAAIVGGKYRGKPLVVAKNPGASVLANALHGKGVQQMPPGGTLPAGDIKSIEAWIASGAKK